MYDITLNGHVNKKPGGKTRDHDEVKTLRQTFSDSGTTKAADDELNDLLAKGWMVWQVDTSSHYDPYSRTWLHCRVVLLQWDDNWDDGDPFEDEIGVPMNFSKVDPAKIPDIPISPDDDVLTEEDTQDLPVIVTMPLIEDAPLPSPIDEEKVYDRKPLREETTFSQAMRSGLFTPDELAEIGNREAMDKARDTAKRTWEELAKNMRPDWLPLKSEVLQ